MTKTDTQKNIVKYFKAQLKPNTSVKIVEGKRDHLRIGYSGDVAELLSKIVPVSITSSPIPLSGSYETKVVTLLEPIKDVAESGDQFYLVLAISATGVLRTKQLTVNSLNISTNVNLSRSALIKETNAAIEKAAVPAYIKEVLHSMVEASAGDLAVQSNYFKEISKSDLNIILKDFGEITGAIWYLSTQSKALQVKFPSASNIRLFDYIIKNTDGEETPVSAKANKGAPPSITSIADILKTMTYFGEKQKAKLAIIAIAEKSTVDGIIEASKDISLPGYVWLKANCFNNRDFTAADCERYLSKFKTIEDMNKALQGFFEVNVKTPKADIVKRIFLTKAKRAGIIISPLGYALVAALNQDPILNQVLNEAAQKIGGKQLYITANQQTKKIEYNIKQFSDSEFKFDYNANSGNPSLKKISFKMVT